jgi:hypothetical protein
VHAFSTIGHGSTRALARYRAEQEEHAMDSDAGGWLWFVIDVVAVIILAAALIYGTIQWRNRRKSRVTDQHRDQATRDLYRREQG